MGIKTSKIFSCNYLLLNCLVVNSNKLKHLQYYLLYTNFKISIIFTHHHVIMIHES
jgi:hypothetical protein